MNDREIEAARRKAEREHAAESQPTLSGMSLDDVKALMASGAPTPGVPAWAQRASPVQRARAARGLHPAGLRLAKNDETCGSCANCYTKHFHGKTYVKCALLGNTNGPGTDIRRKWPACERWEAPK